MPDFNSVDDILEFAIAGEREAQEFYRGLAAKASEPWMADVFKDFAGEEVKHERKLVEVKDGKALMPSAGKVMDLKIAEYVSDVEESSHLDFQDALILAMKREKESFRIYSDLASAIDDLALKGTFVALAQEEAKHKLKIELMYDELILQEN